MKRTYIFLGLLVVVAIVYAGTAWAQVAYTTYTPQTQAETIAYLHGIIAQLRVQLNQPVQHSSVSNYQPNPQVHGVATSLGTNYNIIARTAYGRSDRQSADIHGEIILRNAPFATVWFEYGSDSSLGRTTSRRQVSRDQEISATVSAIRNEKYIYYRVVAEDPNGRLTNGQIRTVFMNDSSYSNSRRNDNEPRAQTLRASSVNDRSARLRGEIEMNDFRNGRVFFVYGESERDIEDVEDENRFSRIRERGRDLVKILVASNLNNRQTYDERVTGLRDDTEYFFRICVEYEANDREDTLECGRVEEFETDRD